MEDQLIIKLFFQRSENAIEELAQKYGKLCNAISINILKNKEDAEECVNDTWLAVWNTVPPKEPNPLQAYVCKITRNLSLKRLEFTKREKRSADIIISFEDLAAVLPDERYAPNISDEDVGKVISEFLHNQKEDAKNVFIRKYYFFDSISEIAKRYSFTESKVKNMLFYTRNKLKDYLIKEGVEI